MPVKDEPYCYNFRAFCCFFLLRPNCNQYSGSVGIQNIKQKYYCYSQHFCTDDQQYQRSLITHQNFCGTVDTLLKDVL